VTGAELLRISRVCLWNANE